MKSLFWCWMLLMMLLVNHVTCRLASMIRHRSFREKGAAEEIADRMDVKRADGDFRELHRVKLPQEDLPVDTRLYIAPSARIVNDRDYDDGKGY